MGAEVPGEDTVVSIIHKINTRINTDENKEWGRSTLAEKVDTDRERKYFELLNH